MLDRYRANCMHFLLRKTWWSSQKCRWNDYTLSRPLQLSSDFIQWPEHAHSFQGFTCYCLENTVFNSWAFKPFALAPRADFLEAIKLHTARWRFGELDHIAWCIVLLFVSSISSPAVYSGLSTHWCLRDINQDLLNYNPSTNDRNQSVHICGFWKSSHYNPSVAVVYLLTDIDYTVMCIVLRISQGVWARLLCLALMCSG